jgi:hypothetical protein
MCTETFEGAVNGTKVNLLCKGESAWPALGGFLDIKE